MFTTPYFLEFALKTKGVFWWSRGLPNTYDKCYVSHISPLSLWLSQYFPVNGQVFNFNKTRMVTKCHRSIQPLIRNRTLSTTMQHHDLSQMERITLMKLWSILRSGIYYMANEQTVLVANMLQNPTSYSQMTSCCKPSLKQQGSWGAPSQKNTCRQRSKEGQATPETHRYTRATEAIQSVPNWQRVCCGTSYKNF